MTVRRAPPPPPPPRATTTTTTTTKTTSRRRTPAAAASAALLVARLLAIGAAASASASASSAAAPPPPPPPPPSASAFLALPPSSAVPRRRRRLGPSTIAPSGGAAEATSIPRAALPLSLPDLEDAVYAAQSAASDLAASSGLSSSSGSGGGGGVGLTLASLILLYGAGLLTSFSPCSLGLLPLTVSYISASAGERDDGAALRPTLAFAAGLASVFVGLGLSASLLGNVFGSSSSSGVGGGASKAALAVLSGGVSVAMGLQLLEIVNLPLPSFELGAEEAPFGSRSESSSRSDGSVGDGEGSTLLFDDEGNIVPPPAEADEADGGGGGGGGPAGSLLRTFLLGGSSALVASPCATPVLASILAYVASSRDPTVGSALLLSYTLGYTTPLLIIGASGGQALASARAAAERGEDTALGRMGGFVTPATAAVLIWYGAGGVLEAVFGDPSLAGLAPILE